MVDGHPLEITRAQAQQYAAELIAEGKEANTVRLRLVSLRQSARCSVDQGELADDPLPGLKPPKLPTKVVEVLTDEQLQAVTLSRQPHPNNEMAVCSSPKLFGATLRPWTGRRSALPPSGVAGPRRHGRGVAAYDPTMDRVVALKLLPANFADDRSSRRVPPGGEARAAAQGQPVAVANGSYSYSDSEALTDNTSATSGGKGDVAVAIGTGSDATAAGGSADNAFAYGHQRRRKRNRRQPRQGLC